MRGYIVEMSEKDIADMTWEMKKAKAGFWGIAGAEAETGVASFSSIRSSEMLLEKLYIKSKVWSWRDCLCGSDNVIFCWRQTSCAPRVSRAIHKIKSHYGTV